MPTDKPRVTFTIDDEKLAKLESYRYENKIKNQTQAILSLIDKGLSLAEAAPNENTKNPPSTAEAAPGGKELEMFDKFLDSLISMGLVRNGKDITDRQAEVLSAVYRILDATFQ